MADADITPRQNKARKSDIILSLYRITTRPLSQLFIVAHGMFTEFLLKRIAYGGYTDEPFCITKIHYSAG
jgi:hypothetical protein